VVERLITLKKKYPNFVVSGIKQLSLMKGNWGGIGTTTVQCPSWATFIRSDGKSEAPMLYR
jgi:hypothetical protein